MPTCSRRRWPNAGCPPLSFKLTDLYSLTTMGLLRMIFWAAVFVASTFAFTVLFEHGTTNYMKNAEKEFAFWKKSIESKVEKKGDQSDKLPH